MSTRVPSIAQLIIISALSPFGMHLIIPAITPIQQEFGASAGIASLLISATMWGIAASTLFFGAYADRFGRRPILLIGLALFFGGSALGWVGQNEYAVIAGRVIQGVGGAAGIVVARTVVRDLYARDKGTSVMAYVTMAIMLAPILAPSFAGFAVENLGWRSVFSVAALIGLLIFLWATRAFPETLKEPIPLPGFWALIRAYVNVLRNPLFVLYTLVAACVMTGFFSMLSGAPHIAELAWDLPRDELGVYLGLAGIGMMASTFITARVAEHVDNNKLMVAGLCFSLTAVAIVATLFSLGYNHPASLFGPMVISGFGSGFVLPTSTTGALSFTPRMAGTASGMMIFLQFALAGTAAQAIGYFDHHTPWAILGFMGGAVSLGLVCAIGVLILLRRQPAAA